MLLIRRLTAALLALMLLQGFLAAPALACTMSHPAGEALAGAAESDSLGHGQHAGHGDALPEHEQCADHEGASDCLAMSACTATLALPAQSSGGYTMPAGGDFTSGDSASPASRTFAPALPPPRS
jgi:hypothetical protein